MATEGSTKSDAKSVEKSDSAIETLWEHCARWGKRAATLSAYLGTLIGLIYFIKIKHVPLDSLSGLAGISGAIALVSLAAFGAMVMLWGVPSMAFQLALQVATADVKALFLKRHKAGASSDITPPVSLPKVLAWTAGTIGAPWLALFAWFIPEYFGGCGWHGEIPLFILSIGLALLVYLIAMASRAGAEDSAATIKHKALRIAIQSGFVICYAFVSGYALLGFLPIASLQAATSGLGVGRGQFVIALCTLGAVAMNTVTIGMAFRRCSAVPDRRWLVSVGEVVLQIFVIAVFMSALEAWGSAQLWVMEQVSVRIPHVRLILDKPACHLLPTGALDPVIGSSPTAPSPPPAEACSMSDVTVLSAVGSRWLVEFATPQGKRSLVLKSDSILRTDRPVVAAPPAAAVVCAVP